MTMSKHGTFKSSPAGRARTLERRVVRQMKRGGVR